jgi:signal peptide peptidase SppA
MHTIASTPWAIQTGVYDALRAWYTSRADAVGVTGAPQKSALELRAIVGNRPDMAQGEDYVVTPGGVALITVSGVLMPKTTGMANMCSPGAASSAAVLRAHIQRAEQDPKVRSALLYIDSPGGNILGVSEAAAALQALSAAKPTVSYTDGLMCSALYWIGSAAPKVYVSGPMVQVGSIGVRMDTADTSGADAKAGVARKTYTFGKYKARGGTGAGGDASSYDAHMQDQVDYLGSLFADTVSAQRGIELERVLAELATGQVFIGQQAIDAGLADGVMSLESLIAALETNPASVTRVPGARNNGKSSPSTRTPTTTQQQPPQQQKGKTAMTPDEIKAQFPDAFNAIHTEGHQAGAAAERARIQGVRASSLPGHEALIEALAFDGTTTGEQAAVKVLAAERTKLEARHTAHFNAGIKPVPVSGGSADADFEASGSGKKPAAPINRTSAYAGLNKPAA